MPSYIIKALNAFSANAFVLIMISPSYAGIVITPSTVDDMLGNDKTGKIVYTKPAFQSSEERVYFIDFSESTLRERRVSDRTQSAVPLISPDGNLVAFSTVHPMYFINVE